MPRTEVPVTTLRGVTDGIAPSAEVACDPVNLNVISNYSNTMWLEVTNTGGVSNNITLITQANIGGRAVADDVVAVAAAGKRRLGPFSKAIYGDSLQFDSVAAMTVAAYQTLPQ